MTDNEQIRELIREELSRLIPIIVSATQADMANRAGVGLQSTPPRPRDDAPRPDPLTPPVQIEIRHKTRTTADELDMWQVWLPSTSLLLGRHGVSVPVAEGELGGGEGPWYDLLNISGDIGAVYAAVVLGSAAKANWPVAPTDCAVKFYKSVADARADNPHAEDVGALWQVCAIDSKGLVQMIHQGTVLNNFAMGDTDAAVPAFDGAVVTTCNKSIERNADWAMQIFGIEGSAVTPSGTDLMWIRQGTGVPYNMALAAIPTGGGGAGKGDADSVALTNQNTIRGDLGEAGDKRLGLLNVSTGTADAYYRVVTVRPVDGAGGGVIMQETVPTEPI